MKRYKINRASFQFIILVVLSIEGRLSNNSGSWYLLQVTTSLKYNLADVGKDDDKIIL